MKISLSLLLCLLLTWFSVAQEVETVHLKKGETFLFKGISQEIRDWYVYIDEAQNYYLANLLIETSEVNQWFVQRKDSQNIYKGIPEIGQYKTISFAKENEPGASLTFYFERKKQDEIELIVQVNGKLRGKIRVAADTKPVVIEQLALENEQVRRFMDGKAVKKVVMVPGKLINIVI